MLSRFLAVFVLFFSTISFSQANSLIYHEGDNKTIASFDFRSVEELDKRRFISIRAARAKGGRKQIRKLKGRTR